MSNTTTAAAPAAAPAAADTAERMRTENAECQSLLGEYIRAVDSFTFTFHAQPKGKATAAELRSALSCIRLSKAQKDMLADIDKLVTSIKSHPAASNPSRYGARAIDWVTVGINNPDMFTSAFRGKH
jgi:hypothetical protein